MPPMTVLDAKQRIGMHEMRRHRDQRAIGQHEVRLVPKLFNAGKNVIPTSAIQSGGMVAQFVKDFVHLKRSRNGFDEHGGANAAARNSQFVLREIERVVPNPGLEMALHLRKIEIRAAAAIE